MKYKVSHDDIDFRGACLARRGRLFPFLTNWGGASFFQKRRGVNHSGATRQNLGAARLNQAHDA